MSFFTPNYLTSCAFCHLFSLSTIDSHPKGEPRNFCKSPLPQKTPGGVEPLPYANLEVLAIQRKQCDFADASWRVDVGIDPYKRATDSPGCIRACGCILLGGQGRPPLRARAYSHRCVQICGIVLPGGASPAPTLRRKTPLHTKTRERRLPFPGFPLYCPPICSSSIPRTCAGGMPSTKPNSPKSISSAAFQLRRSVALTERRVCIRDACLA